MTDDAKHRQSVLMRPLSRGALFSLAAHGSPDFEVSRKQPTSCKQEGAVRSNEMNAERSVKIRELNPR